MILIKNRQERIRFFKFLVVGSIGFVVDFSVFNLFRSGIGLSPEISSVISFIAAVISNFIFNRYWTYPDSRSKSPRRQFVMFFLVSLTGILIRVPIITFLHGPLTNLIGLVPILEPYAQRLGENSALAIAVIIVLFWNFFANRYWTYSDVE